MRIAAAVDEVAIYGRVLDGTELEEHFNAGAP